MILLETEKPSRSIGTTSKGSLENGKRLPTRGDNFITYSYIGAMLGRNAVHDKVRDLVVAVYDTLNILHPEKQYKYGETGWVTGGDFYPHKTHENGLSVDFMTPVKDETGASVLLPTSIFNKFGYSIDFDKRGKYEDLQTDFESISSHLYFLNKLAPRYGVKVKRVIYYPELQKYLWKSKYGSYLKQNITFSKKRSWVIHDDHYHVDFEVMK